MKYLKHILSIVTILIVCVAVYWAIKYDAFGSVDNFKEAVDDAGLWGPALFIVLQTIATIVLFIPCMVGYPVATMCFGTVMGFILNYISALLGGMFIYLLVHKYGVEFVKQHTSKKVLTKYERLRYNTDKCERVLAIALTFPCFPDNAISYVVSLSDITFKRYMLISMLCKPWQLLAYSWGWGLILDWAERFMQTL